MLSLSDNTQAGVIIKAFSSASIYLDGIIYR